MEKLYSSWTTEEEKQQAFEETSSSYEQNGIVHSSKAYLNRSYIDIEPDRSIRSTMTRQDYYRFRPEESIPTRQKRIIKNCMDAYDKVGIVRNVIDLMGDFAAQGIDIVHENESIERFYQKWFDQVGGTERSERFLNYLYRCGNVVVKRRTAKINKKKELELKKTSAADMDIEPIKYEKREIPWVYDFLNPISVDVADKTSTFIGEPKYVFNLSKTTFDTFGVGGPYQQMTTQLPPDIQKSLKNGSKTIPLDPNKIEVYHYKKDDWSIWANPMIYAILDDIAMLEKMKLADLAALDGAISQIRLWRLGSLEHQILPKSDVINKLRNILASNTGGGTMDLVWGPELDFKESQSQVYRFLGSEKYQPVLTSIYAGLGIPPTLTGASSSGGYSNNFVSLKTLVERLEYGRQLLVNFWTKEIKIIQKAMGFKKPAQIRFKSIILSDEAAYKNLLINLVDRNILSEQTVIERFGEIPGIETIRINREEKERRKNGLTPQKASPYHNPNIRQDMAKLLTTKDALEDEYYEEIDIPKKEGVLMNPPPPGGKFAPPKSAPQGGRPLNAPDSVKRKKKKVLPKSSDKAAAILWARKAQKTISEITTPMFLSFAHKEKAVSLTEQEFSQLEHLKLCLLANIEPFMEIDVNVIKNIIDHGYKIDSDLKENIRDSINSFVYLNNRQPTIDEVRYIYSSCYIDFMDDPNEDI